MCPNIERCAPSLYRKTCLTTKDVPNKNVPLSIYRGTTTLYIQAHLFWWQCTDLLYRPKCQARLSIYRLYLCVLSYTTWRDFLYTDSSFLMAVRRHCIQTKMSFYADKNAILYRQKCMHSIQTKMNVVPDKNVKKNRCSFPTTKKKHGRTTSTTHAHTYTHTHTHTHTYTHIHTHTHTHTLTHMDFPGAKTLTPHPSRTTSTSTSHTHTHMHHIHTHTYTHANTQTHTHTHTQGFPWCQDISTPA